MDIKPKIERIYKFAANYNLNADIIVEFLQKKGYDVKSHMSPITEEMIRDIKLYYSKDIAKAEKHYAKISQFINAREASSKAETNESYSGKVVIPDIISNQVAENTNKSNAEESSILNNLPSVSSPDNAKEIKNTDLIKENLGLREEINKLSLQVSELTLKYNEILQKLEGLGKSIPGKPVNVPDFLKL